MNWYEIFYWVTVADGVKGFFDAISNVFLFLSIISFITYWIVFFSYRSERTGEEPSDPKERKEYRFWVRVCRNTFIWCFTLMTITWAGYVFCPSKKDAIVIIAGGAVGNFITSDSSAKQIPAELTLLIRERMRSEIKEIKSDDIFSVDTLAGKSKEELIELLKKK
jgi:hypothetical protein